MPGLSLDNSTQKMVLAASRAYGGGESAEGAAMKIDRQPVPAISACPSPDLPEADRRVARCRACVVRRNALFVHLSLQELDELAPRVPDSVVPAGQALYREGDRPEALFIMRRGVVKLEQYRPDGTYRIVRLAHRANLLALESVLETPCDHTAVALTDVEVCRVPLDVVRLVMAKQDWIATQMIRHWHQMVQRADGWLTRYSTGGGRQRMANFIGDLHDLAAREEQEERLGGPAEGAAGSPVIQLPSRDDVGAILGVTKETASRVIAEFRREGLLKNVDRWHVRVARDRLAVIAGQDE